MTAQFTLPVPRMTVWITSSGRVVDATGQPPDDAPVVTKSRRACHCTTCGKPGHNSRSKNCPGPEVAP